ncbi:MAG: MFS transporter [Gammaproteobacteria bacterium]
MSKLNLIFASRLISSTADQILVFLIPLIIFKITGSAALSGLSFTLEWIPRVMAFLLSGLWGDKVGGNSLYIKTDFYRGSLICFFLILLAVRHENAFWILTFIGTTTGFFSSQAQISLEMTIKNNFKEVDIPKAQANVQMCEQLSLILGPLVAGALLIFTKYTLPIGVTGFLFFIAGFINKVVFTNEVTNNISIQQSTNIFSILIRGCRNIWKSKYLRLLVSFSILANFFYGVILSLNPAIIKGLFQESDQKLTLMYTIAGVVTIIMLSLVSFLNRLFSVKFIGFIGISIFLLSAILLSQASSYEIYALLYATLIAGVMLTNVMTRTYRVKLIPPADFGITIGIIMFLIKIAMPISGLYVLTFAKIIDLQRLILISVISSVLLFLILWPILFREKNGAQTTLESHDY